MPCDETRLGRLDAARALGPVGRLERVELPRQRLAEILRGLAHLERRAASGPL